MADKLNLGAGSDALAGFINVDRYAAPEVDELWDLDDHPWPWETDSIETIRAFDIFEHVDRPIEFMNECWRILVPGGRLELHTTYWKSENSYTDPTHKRFCTERTWDYWIKGADYHRRYGAAYSEGRHFGLLRCAVEGQELAVTLVKHDRCEGAC